MSKTIRDDEWLAELERLSTKNDRGHTAYEIAAAIGRSVKITREMLRRVMALGRLVMGLRTISRIDGRPATIPVYRIMQAGGIISKGVKRRAKRR